MAISLPLETMVQRLDALPGNDHADVSDDNLCPAARGHTVTGDGTRRRMRALRSGLKPHWCKAHSDRPLLIVPIDG